VPNNRVSSGGKWRGPFLALLSAADYAKRYADKAAGPR
jgi:hypothetical protein